MNYKYTSLVLTALLLSTIVCVRSANADSKEEKQAQLTEKGKPATIAATADVAGVRMRAIREGGEKTSSSGVHSGFTSSPQAQR